MNQNENAATAGVKPPIWFWIVAVVALLWNLMGVLAFIGQMMMTEEMYAEMPAEQAELYRSIPVWSNVAFAVGTFCGTLGCVFLLMRKNWALPVFIVSIVGVIVQFGYMFIMTNTMEVMGPASAIFPAIVFLLSIGLIFLSLIGIRNQWLR